MSITIQTAKQYGDKKLRAIKSSEIVNAIKSVLTSQNIALSVGEINDELVKRYDAKTYDSFFVSSDKSAANNKTKLLKIRLNDLVYNTRKSETVQFKRAFDAKTNAHYYYAQTVKALSDITNKAKA